MSVWSAYEERFRINDDNPKRASELTHIQSRMRRSITASPSYQTVKLGNEERSFAIVDDNDFDTKKIFSMPGEELPHGSAIEWAGSFWLITECNARKDFCTEGKMRQCNHFLRWIDSNGNLIGRWCVVEDGTKYLAGEKSSGLMAIGDARIAVTVGKDRDTDKLSRGNRFLIDDPDTNDILAYEITKPNRLFNVYNGKGVFRFILTEDSVTDDDNLELRIADYYSWRPPVNRPIPDSKTGSTIDEVVASAIEKKENLPSDISERKVWL